MYNVDSNSIDFYKLWSDSIAELDPETRIRFYHHIKLDSERKAEDECHAFGAFERLRFEAKDNSEIVVVEGHCKPCGLYTPVAGYPNGLTNMAVCSNSLSFSICKYLQSDSCKKK